MRTTASVAIAVSLLGFSACDKPGAGGGEGSNAPLEGPAKPTYERRFDELMDVPNQMGQQIAWAAQPINDAATLADEVAAVKAKANMDDAQFQSMFKAALTEGKVEVAADANLGESRAEIEASLAKIKQVGTDLKNVPARVKVAGKGIAKLGMGAPKLALQASKELGGELKVATGDDKVKIEADIKAAKEMPNTVKAELAKARATITELPAKAAISTKNLVAAIEGKPYEKQEPIGGGVAPPTDPAAVGDPATGPTTPAAEPTAPASEPSAASADGAAADVPPPPSGPAVPAAEVPAPAADVPPPPSGPAGEAPPSGAPADPAKITARVSALQNLGDAAGKREDWLSAADAFEEAYVLAPEDQFLAFKAGDSAYRAKDCERAQVYLQRFAEYGDGAAHANEMAAAKKTLGEMKAFPCPAATPEDKAARAETLAMQAQALGAEDDWGGAALKYAEAYQLAPEEHMYAYRVAISSWNAHECGDAQSYFNHFVNVGDAKAHRSQLRETKSYLKRAAAGDCAAWTASAKDAHARSLYAQGQALEDEYDFLGAIGKYERAYLLLPDNHALAWRIASSAWKAQNCELTQKHVNAFVQHASDPRYQADLPQAQALASKIQGHGCPDALWATGPGPGNAGGAGDEVPPESGKKGCSVAGSEASTQAWMCLLLLIGGVGVGRVRRRHR